MCVILMEVFLGLLEACLCFSAAYHHEIDGATERMNKSLEHVLHCCAIALEPNEKCTLGTMVG